MADGWRFEKRDQANPNWVAKSDVNKLELKVDKNGGRRMEGLIQRKHEKVRWGEKIENPIGERKRHPEITRDTRKAKSPTKFKIKSQQWSNQRELVKHQEMVDEKRKIYGGKKVPRDTEGYSRIREKIGGKEARVDGRGRPD